ncbi:MAG TPA: C4-type zinc ribbon domain-containing protein [Fimbriimonadaceae bacterium]|nr:C4-type zinc ribbon domain-containing protein [Fimbriimonadaceae bacterium]
MTGLELRKLYKLHLVDSAIVDIRKRAAALDPGKKILGEIAALEAELSEKGGAAKGLSQEQTDLELQQKSIEEKLKRIDKKLYGGKVVNPREVETYEKEIAALKRQRSENDGRLLELWDLAPPAKAASEKIEQEIAAKKGELAEHQKKVVSTRTQLEQLFKEKSAQRPVLAKEVPPAYLARYEAIRQKQGGIGMAEVIKGQNCGACGMALPRKSVETAKEGKIVTCESCHRILYASEGLL